jgi:hypothetical protein
MEPKRLTDDDLRAIRARAELFKPSDLSDYKLIELHDWAHTQFIVQKLAGYTHVGMVVDELQGRRRMAADIPALLAHADALAARVADLEAALRKVCEAAVYVQVGAYTGDVSQLCIVCDTETEGDGALHHAPGCPVAAALALLEGGA